MYNQHLKKYLDFGFHQIEGWVETDLFDLIDLFDSMPINKNGGVCEIGVHHGRLFILLNQTTQPQFESYAIDLFGEQHLNIDNSGCGNAERFQEYLSKYDRHAGKNTVIISGDSTDSGLELTKRIKPGSIKFFSIDGGHTPTHTLNDLKIANELISNEGVVILDDILNHRWLGVIEGAVNFLQTRPTLVPFAMGHNKLYFCKFSHYNFYYNLLLNSHLSRLGTLTKNKFFGHDILSYRYWPQVPW